MPRPRLRPQGFSSHTRPPPSPRNVRPRAYLEKRRGERGSSRVVRSHWQVLRNQLSQMESAPRTETGTAQTSEAVVPTSLDEDLTTRARSPGCVT